MSNEILSDELVTKDGKVLLIKFKKSKRTALAINHLGVTALISRGIQKKDILKYVESNFIKIYSTFQNLSFYGNPDNFFINEVYFNLIFEEGNFSYFINEEKQLIFVSGKVKKTSIIKFYEKLLEDFINENELKIKNILIKNSIIERPIIFKVAKSYLGAYNRKKDLIRINPFIMKFSHDVVMYVILHEYAHTVSFKHDKLFHEALEKLCPNHRVIEKKSRKNKFAVYI
ncbi:MAG: M48 family metallopeptidase [Acholeplasmatales bacterium]|jgi:predicted metal-dependent hydrolase|nr:M48 family metallopeptidase [Acholeplasmatales bacterium]